MNKVIRKSKKPYVSPTMNVVHMWSEGENCQTVPVYYSTAGPGVAGARQGTFLEEAETDNVWETMFNEKDD